MKIHVSDATVHLEGDWSISGLTKGNISSLVSALHQIECGDATTLPVDCRHITAIDGIGQQLLSGWLQIARCHGIKPELVNIPANLGRYFKKQTEGNLTRF